jgi:DNA-binding transcriptional LysR family regulator
MSRTETLSDISIFVAVADAGSFTSAADKLGLSKSQVSKCVSRLERSLGARLMNRTTRRLRLTEAGATLYESSKNALGQIDDAQIAVSRLQGAPRGKLIVSASIAFGSVQLPAVVRELTGRHAELAIELRLEDRHVDLVREGIDVAIRITEDTRDSTLVYRRLGRNRMIVCAAPAYLTRRGIPRTPQDLVRHECIVHTQRASPKVWHFTARDGKNVAVNINGRIAISSSLAVREAALEGVGIIELNSYLVGPDILSGRLVRLLPGYEPRELSIYAVFPQRRYLAPKVQVFIDAMLARMTPEPAWDAFLKRETSSGRAAPAARSALRDSRSRLAPKPPDASRSRTSTTRG